MQPAWVIAGAGVLGAAIAVLVGYRGAPEPGAQPATRGAEDAAALRREVEQLREAMRAPVSRPAPAPVPQPAAAAPAPRVVITDAQVAAALARRAAPAPPARPPYDVEAAFTELRGKNPWGYASGWQKVTAAGAWDEVIARFQRNEKEQRTPQAQFELALAFLARQQSDPQNYELSIEADKWFDRALEGDPRHWEARFTKAMCYTFWPDFLGKKPEAMRHFETLIEQQEEGPARPNFAQTYLFLGNMYDERGESAKARELWARGARLFPQNQELQKKVK